MDTNADARSRAPAHIYSNARENIKAEAPNKSPQRMIYIYMILCARYKYGSVYF